MELNVDDRRLIDGPTREQVLEALDGLDADGFVILARADEHYVQTALNEGGAWQLEYRDGAADRHFAADPAAVSDQDVRDAFLLYLAGDDPASALAWGRVDVTASLSDPGEGEVTYHGVTMDAGWPAEIEAAQDFRTIELGGTEYSRIPFGSETREPTAGLPHCGECGVRAGLLHVPDCGVEQCPACGGPLADCDCEELDDPDDSDE